MPILRKESEIHPPELFSIPIETAAWLVAHVRSRQEKLLARFLEQHDRAFYLPQVEHESVRGGRTVTSFLPLFPGYIFLRRTPGIEIVWKSNVVANLIDPPDQAQLDLELSQLRALQESGAFLTPYPSVRAGDAVRITEGVFRDYVGVVVREKDRSRLVVSVSSLHKSVAVEYPRSAVTRARSHESSAARRD